MSASQRMRNVWMTVQLPFVMVWMLWKAFLLVLVVLGIKRPKARVGDLRFPILMIASDRELPVVETTAEGLRENPLAVFGKEKVTLIDSDLKVYTQTNVHQRYSDIAALWRMIAPSDRSPKYASDLKRRRSGLAMARRHVLGCPAYAELTADVVAKRDAIESATTMDQLIAIICGKTVEPAMASESM